MGFMTEGNRNLKFVNRESVLYSRGGIGSFGKRSNGRPSPCRFNDLTNPEK